MKPLTVELRLSPELYTALDQMAEKAHSSKGDLVRKAFALMQVVVQVKSEGKKLAILDQNQNIEQEIVGL